MKSNSLKVSRLIAAFTAGDRKEFAAAVSALGVSAAAETLVDYLFDETTDVRLLRLTSYHLLDRETLRSIPEAQDFISALLEELTDSDDEEETILDVIEALGANILAHHLENVEPLRLGRYGAAWIAATVENLPNPVEWAEAAICFQDAGFLESVMPNLTSKDRFRLWMTRERFDSIFRVNFMLANELAPHKVAEKRCILKDMASKGEEAKVLETLVDAWPEAVAGFAIVPLPRNQYSYWTGRALALLLASGASLARENWINVFRWDLPAVIVEQTDELAARSPRLIDWNIPNAGRGFLEEVFDKLAYSESRCRLLILKQLLDVKVDPRPLTAPWWQSKLSLAEKKLLVDAVAKISALKPRSDEPVMEADVQLV